MTVQYDDLVQQFGRIWPVHVEQFTELLITLRRQFGGDLDRMLVLAIIGSRTLPPRRTEGLRYGHFLQQQQFDLQPAPLNIQSIAECSGIPRETVRRKVRDLVALGWICKQADGYLIASKTAAVELAPATEATLRYLAAVTSACVDATTGQTNNTL